MDETQIDFFKNLSNEEIKTLHKKDNIRAKKQYDDFLDYFNKGKCYICKNSLKSFSSKKVCLHSLLRLNSNFKVKHFKDIISRFGYFNISSYLRWVSNTDKFAKNINDLKEEMNSNKEFEYTIKWKNKDFSFSCSKNDFLGHSGTNTDYPHYHFQMRIDGGSFINYSTFHIKFSDYDLWCFDFMEKCGAKNSWGDGGIGMQDLLDNFDQLPDFTLDELRSTDNKEEAQVRLSTYIEGPISGDEYNLIVEEAKKSGKTITAVAKERLGKDKVTTIIEPIQDIPDIAKRTERKR